MGQNLNIVDRTDQRRYLVPNVSFIDVYTGYRQIHLGTEYPEGKPEPVVEVWVTSLDEVHLHGFALASGAGYVVEIDRLDWRKS